MQPERRVGRGMLLKFSGGDEESVAQPVGLSVSAGLLDYPHPSLHTHTASQLSLFLYLDATSLDAGRKGRRDWNQRVVGPLAFVKGQPADQPADTVWGRGKVKRKVRGCGGEEKGLGALRCPRAHSPLCCRPLGFDSLCA